MASKSSPLPTSSQTSLSHFQMSSPQTQTKRSLVSLVALQAAVHGIPGVECCFPPRPPFPATPLTKCRQSHGPPPAVTSFLLFGQLWVWGKHISRATSDTQTLPGRGSLSPTAACAESYVWRQLVAQGETGTGLCLWVDPPMAKT
jgi:hypothetical protein